jgi:hypothetical protein
LAQRVCDNRKEIGNEDTKETRKAGLRL